jgi:hypothetical protein
VAKVAQQAAAATTTTASSTIQTIADDTTIDENVANQNEATVNNLLHQQSLATGGTMVRYQDGGVESLEDEYGRLTKKLKVLEDRITSARTTTASTHNQGDNVIDLRTDNHSQLPPLSFPPPPPPPTGFGPAMYPPLSMFARAGEKHNEKSNRTKFTRGIKNRRVKASQFKAVCEGCSWQGAFQLPQDMLPDKEADRYDAGDCRFSCDIAFGAMIAHGHLSIAFSQGSNDGHKEIVACDYEYCRLILEYLQQEQVRVTGLSHINELSAYAQENLGFQLLETYSTFVQDMDDGNVFGSVRRLYSPRLEVLSQAMREMHVRVATEGRKQARAALVTATKPLPVPPQQQSRDNNSWGNNTNNNRQGRNQPNNNNWRTNTSTSQPDYRHYISKCQGLCMQHLMGRCQRAERCRFPHEWGTPKHIEVVTALKLTDFESKVGNLLEPSGSAPRN